LLRKVSDTGHVIEVIRDAFVTEAKVKRADTAAW
jgi:hypothetical protein